MAADVSDVPGGEWFVQRSDGTKTHEPARQARQELHRRRAVQVGHMAIRRLAPGESYGDALATEARKLSDRQGIPVAAARLVILCWQAAWKSDPGTTLDNLQRTGSGSPKDIALARSIIRRSQDLQHRQHAARLREHRQAIRQVHELHPTDPISAVALPRRAQMPKLVAHGRGPALCGAATCGGLSSAAIRLAGGSHPALAARRDPSEQIQRAEDRAQSFSL